MGTFCNCEQFTVFMTKLKPQKSAVNWSQHVKLNLQQFANMTLNWIVLLLEQNQGVLFSLWVFRCLQLIN